MKIKRDALLYIVVVIILILFVSTLILNSGNKNTSEVSESFSTCLGENSVLYVQEGCSACEIQEEMFGQYYDKLETIDCVYQPNECNVAGISATPTWIINGEKHVGVQYLDELSEISGCEL